MTYRIIIGNWGSECVAGEIPDNIWKYIEDECEGDASLYRDKLDAGEVPEEFQLASDSGSFYDVDSFYNEYGPYCHSTLTICDEDGCEELMTIDSKDVTSEFQVMSAPSGKPYFVWESVEKGGWHVDIETDDEKFDKDKLKLHMDKLAYDNDNNGIAFIHAVEYDGNVYDVELDSTTGKSYELSFFKDEDED